MTNECAGLLNALNFAAIKHKDQRRKDPEETPYINHPIGVAHILANEGGVNDLAVLQAAILHDTVEDTDTSLNEIEDHFGQEIRSIVAEVTDNKLLPKQERKLQQIAHAPKTSCKGKLVKLADKLYNLRDLDRVNPVGWTEGRREEYFEWAAKVCHGLRGTNERLEKELERLFNKRGISMMVEQH